MNEALRAHVTRVGFDLTLGKTHIAALVLVNEGWAKDRYIHTPAGRNRWTFFVPGVHGLINRGLVWHCDPGPPAKRKPPKEIYGLTSAGQYVVGLLCEVGIYQEYAADLPVVEAAS